MMTINCDIVLLQEINTDCNSFACCDFINSNYTIYRNNARNGFGTATLVSSSLRVGESWYDKEGRVIILDVGDFTVGNIYMPSGTDHRSRQAREILR